MPMLEVLRAADRPLTAAQKRAFAREATRIFHQVLGTPPGRLRLFFLDTSPEGLEGLHELPPAGESDDHNAGSTA
ncbi:tautomerase family protein [Thermogemmatispora tikiterensis]|uniref:4-oxalocrotonate tautomerase domain-containing protein n=1 Tax=Thermogemmatispora tikiterensis TaxID=1825093 RepID=A0A328VT12_9CHLR|nr:hypothetical protein [Thermogemmatispora tikiterensis]RAQ98424.1 hypothetical protein A4R35_22980 [Thermogemmatispora tikiterensis]